MVTISQNGLEYNCNLAQVDEVKWTVSECVGRFVMFEMPGSFYWNVRVTYNSPPGTPREFVLESGILDGKVKAFTHARKRARHFKGERHRERGAHTATARLIPGMKGWQ